MLMMLSIHNIKVRGGQQNSKLQKCETNKETQLWFEVFEFVPEPVNVWHAIIKIEKITATPIKFTGKMQIISWHSTLMYPIPH